MNADDYLSLPTGYAEALGGLRWSKSCDAIELGDGRTLAVVEQLASVLEGVFTAYPAVPHFAHVVHLLKLSTRKDDRVLHEPLTRLFEAFQAAARQGTSRNVGVLFAHLCRKLPHVASPPSPAGLQLTLKRRLLFPEESGHRLTERPAFGPTEFERRLAEVVFEYNLPELIHWIRHGCASLDHAGRRLADILQEPPKRQESLLTVIRRRLRLAGAVALAPTLDAAFALPPRHHQHEALPQGGYAGVVTRGDPERLLPSQFALDSFDFVRRFAENELLYFRREELHRGQRPERLIVLDQGVRTWGGVRLALAAAVIAQIGKDRQRFGPLRLAATSADGAPIDVAEATPESLADLLEASDLSPHPAAILSSALRALPGDGVRDVVLLTHPRNAQEAEVRAAISDRGLCDRIFALTVDEDGNAELGEWRKSGPVCVRSFRVDLASAEMRSTPATPKPAPTSTSQPWTGDVEPILYPFCPGLIGRPHGFTFDASGEWLVAHGVDGVLQAIKLNGSTTEIWPRAFAGGSLLQVVDAILGLEGGIAVCGRMSALKPNQFSATVPTNAIASAVQSVVAHYDLTDRRVTLHTLGAMGAAPGKWYAFPDLSSIALQAPGGRRSIDLTLGCQYPSDFDDKRSEWRAKEAYERADALVQPPPTIVHLKPGQQPASVVGPWLSITDGAVTLGNVDPPWQLFTPTSEGRRLLDKTTAIGPCQLASQSLAVAARFQGSHGQRLFLFQGPSGRVLGNHDLTAKYPLFQLSSDGRLLARQTTSRSIEVTDVANSRPASLIGWAGIHQNIRVTRQRRWLRVSIGAYTHAFALDSSPLHYRSRLPELDDLTLDPVRPAPHLPNRAQYDPKRFHLGSIHGTVLLIDWVGGQVVLLHSDGQPAVHILVRRDRAAIVLPDGTCWGNPVLLGRPESPDAAEKIGEALRSIWRN